mmetsp:Transcript_126790/g.344199  ORF Transcript_126790/g.344199 Transcript_126790/m.344199 type:complete len:202 (+) Transcript_126790:784-1389(+)
MRLRNSILRSSGEEPYLTEKMPPVGIRSTELQVRGTPLSSGSTLPLGSTNRMSFRLLVPSLSARLNRRLAASRWSRRWKWNSNSVCSGCTKGKHGRLPRRFQILNTSCGSSKYTRQIFSFSGSTSRKKSITTTSAQSCFCPQMVNNSRTCAAFRYSLCATVRSARTRCAGRSACRCSSCMTCRNWPSESAPAPGGGRRPDT